MTTATRRQAAATAGLVVFAVLGTPGAAVAQPEAGTSVRAASTSAATTTGCPLRRLGNHMVRCDSLTGAGVAAPGWMAEG